MMRASKKVFWLPLLFAGLFLAAVILLFSDSGSTVERRRGGEPLTGETSGVQRRGAWLDEVVFTRESDPGKVVHQIEIGHLDLFASGINNPTIYNRIRDSLKTDYAVSYGSSVELTMNTAEFADPEQLNPFHNRRIREAMNWLLDRDYIAAELFGGLAAPRYLPMSTVLPDYARLAESARAIELHYRFDARRAEAIIREELQAMGAELKNGRWHYRGAEMEIRILIRTEDARRELGDYVANLMETLGFRVQRMYRTAGEASRIWIAADPAGGGWHLYTGGWVAVVINRDLAGDLDQFYTPRGRPEPLWQSYDPDPELDALAERLRRRDYATWQERQEMMARGMKLALEESTRVWLLDQKSVWPHATNVEFAADLAGGFSGSAMWPYTLRFTDRVGGRMMVGVPNLLTEPWNPVAGTNWIFDRMITRALSDPVVLPDPFTGLFRPQRLQQAEVTVQKGVPVNRTLDWVSLAEADEIVVPPDTWLAWDRGKQRFLTVGEKNPEGLTARTRTRVVYQEDYLQRVWHDGAEVSLADIVLPWILFFERTNEESPLFDRAEVPIFQSFITHFRGWRIVDQQPLTIEIYSDQIFPDAEWIVGSRAPGTAPWHMLALGIMAETHQRLAFSSDKADQLGIEWMNLVGGPSLSILDQELLRASAENFVPYAQFLARFLEPGEAADRYRALSQWRRRHGHFMVGDGPYYLHSARPIEGTVVLRRNRNFSDLAGKWGHFEEAAVPEPHLEGPEIVGIGEHISFDLRIEYHGQPYPSADLERIAYMLFDSGDRLIEQGEIPPEHGDDGVWRISFDPRLTRELEIGANSLEVAVTSRLVALPSFVSRAFATIPPAEE